MCLGLSKLHKSSNFKTPAWSLEEYKSMKHSLLQQDFISPYFWTLPAKCSLIVRKSLVDRFSARPLKIQIIVQQPNHFLGPGGSSFGPTKHPHVVFKYGEFFQRFYVVHIAFWEEKSWCVFPRVFLDFYPHCTFIFLAFNLFNGEIYHLEDRKSFTKWKLIFELSKYFIELLFNLVSYLILSNCMTIFIFYCLPPNKFQDTIKYQPKILSMFWVWNLDVLCHFECNVLIYSLMWHSGEFWLFLAEFK